MKLFVLLTLGAALLFGAVDINTATKSELMSLKGIGEKKAEAILAYRSQHCFKDINALKSVKGIGIKLIAKNKANLTAGKCK